MKFGKKLWTIALLCCFALTLGLVGCGGNTDDPGKTDGPGTGGENPPATTYSVTLTKDFEDAMGTATLSAPASGDKYAKDELVTLTVTVNEGYLLNGVTVGSETVELEEGKYSFKVKEDTTVTVSMRAIAYYKVTLTGFTEEEGSVKFTPAANADGKFQEGTNVTFTVTPGKRYTLKSVKIDGTEATPADGVYSFTANKDVTVEVLFEERTDFQVSVTFDDKMCDVTYIGEDGEATSLKAGGTFSTDYELALTVVLNGGYKLVSATVNGEAATLDGNGFTVTVSEDLVIVVECVWDVTTKESLAGEYDLADDIWYTFTLAEDAAFDFTASNYIAYAAFYKVETVEEPAKGTLPVWIFNSDGRAIQEVHAFAAGTYVARFSANSGDGIGSSKLVISAVTLLSFELPEVYNGSWQSTDVVENDTDADDHIWSIYVGNGCFVLKKKDASGVYSVVNATVASADGGYTVTAEEKTYQLIPAYGQLIGTLSLYGEETQIVFLPNPLPTVKPPKELVGTYAGVNYEDDTPMGDLSVTENGMTWDGKPLTLLSELSLEGSGLGAASPAALYEGKLYMISAQPAGSTDPDDPEAPLTYAIMLIDPEAGTSIMFTPKAEQSVTIDAQFLGTWECQVATAALYGYTLEITENNIVVKDASGQVVQATVGMTTYYTRDYASFTINGTTYILQSAKAGTLTIMAMGAGTRINFKQV